MQLICQRKANSVICAFENVFGVRGWTKSLKVEREGKFAILLLHRPKNDSAPTYSAPDLKRNSGSLQVFQRRPILDQILTKSLATKNFESFRTGCERLREFVCQKRAEPRVTSH